MYALGSQTCIMRNASRYTFNLAQLGGTSRAVSNTPPALFTTTIAANSQPPPNKKATNRIASSWNDVVIPTREEVAQRRKDVILGQDGGNIYKPDLSYLKNRPSTFAGKLAALNKRAEAPTPKPTSPTKRSSQVDSKKHDRQPPDTGISHSHESERPAHRKFTVVDLEKLAYDPKLLMARRNQAVNTKSIEKVSQRGSPYGQRNSQGRRMSLPTHGDKNSSKRTSIGIRVLSPRKTPQNAGDITALQDDITLDIIENGGDVKEYAEFANPDLHLTDLDTLFGPSLKIPSSLTARSSLVQKQWLRETHGGDYVRFAAQTTDYTTRLRDLGPAKHAQLVLARRRDVTIGAREEILTVITSVASDNGKVIPKS